MSQPPISKTNDASTGAQEIKDNSHVSSPNAITSKSTHNYRGFDHLTWFVGNAKQAASYFINRFGFEEVAYRGLETGSRILASHVVSNSKCTFVLTSPLHGVDVTTGHTSDCDKSQLKIIHDHLNKHGDGVKDVAFEVDDAAAMYKEALVNGVQGVHEPTVLRDDCGEVTVATVKTYGDTTHTFIQRSGYWGVFLPGFQLVASKDPLTTLLPKITLVDIDHCVGNQDWGHLKGIEK